MFRSDEKWDFFVESTSAKVIQTVLGWLLSMYKFNDFVRFVGSAVPTKTRAVYLEHVLPFFEHLAGMQIPNILKDTPFPLNSVNARVDEIYSRILSLNNKTLSQQLLAREINGKQIKQWLSVVSSCYYLGTDCTQYLLNHIKTKLSAVPEVVYAVDNGHEDKLFTLYHRLYTMSFFLPTFPEAEIIFKSLLAMFDVPSSELINCKFIYGRNLLHVCIEELYFEVGNKLIQKLPEQDCARLAITQNSYGEYPIDSALKQKDFEKIKCLFKYMTYPEKPNKITRKSINDLMVRVIEFCEKNIQYKPWLMGQENFIKTNFPEANVVKMALSKCVGEQKTKVKEKAKQKAEDNLASASVPDYNPAFIPSSNQSTETRLPREKTKQIPKGQRKKERPALPASTGKPVVTTAKKPELAKQAKKSTPGIFGYAPTESLPPEPRLSNRDRALVLGHVYKADTQPQPAPVKSLPEQFESLPAEQQAVLNQQIDQLPEIILPEKEFTPLAIYEIPIDQAEQIFLAERMPLLKIQIEALQHLITRENLNDLNVRRCLWAYSTRICRLFEGFEKQQAAFHTLGNQLAKAYPLIYCEDEVYINAWQEVVYFLVGEPLGSVIENLFVPGRLSFAVLLPPLKIRSLINTELDASEKSENQPCQAEFKYAKDCVRELVFLKQSMQGQDDGERKALLRKRGPEYAGLLILGTALQVLEPLMKQNKFFQDKRLSEIRRFRNAALHSMFASEHQDNQGPCEPIEPLWKAVSCALSKKFITTMISAFEELAIKLDEVNRPEPETMRMQ